jgi:drug/metabolite transporter (DMT)-like permease
MDDGRTTTNARDDRTQTGPNPNPNERGKWLSALIALIGVWMIVEPILFELAAAQLWNDIVVGLLLVAAGGYNYSRQTSEKLGSPGMAGIAAFLGLWLVATPFLFGTGIAGDQFTESLGAWNDFTIGLVTFLLGAYSAYRIRSRRQPTQAAG